MREQAIRTTEIASVRDVVRDTQRPRPTPEARSGRTNSPPRHLANLKSIHQDADTTWSRRPAIIFIRPDKTGRWGAASKRPSPNLDLPTPCTKAGGRGPDAIGGGLGAASVCPCGSGMRLRDIQQGVDTPEIPKQLAPASRVSEKPGAGQDPPRRFARTTSGRWQPKQFVRICSLVARIWARGVSSRLPIITRSGQQAETLPSR